MLSKTSPLVAALLVAAGCGGSAHQPGDRCDTSNPCASGFVCFLHVCNALSCNPACSSTQYCNQYGQCAEPPGSFCRKDAQCQPGWKCDTSTDACIGNANPAAGTPCTDSSQCPTGTLCVGSQCGGMSGDPCSADADCVAQYCYAGYCE